MAPGALFIENSSGNLWLLTKRPRDMVTVQRLRQAEKYWVLLRRTYTKETFHFCFTLIGWVTDEGALL